MNFEGNDSDSDIELNYNVCSESKPYSFEPQAYSTSSEENDVVDKLSGLERLSNTNW